ncbi:Gfo/Idh/MocA family protein [Jiangella asiatica]|uniref:Gfo/Idh/MocA family oxidoreductase n=1 Tax=Jiangella asiatica TaxID=2530372 RepID=A0A4R5DNB8_9ACTN|nr:Gfo/Idh/MocA family oxidoreductase [Jiangella asiatica]TDE13580.1 Gfo/Idh/MocA family oxidoreductase [Jiangella asiatica]
MRVVVVGVGFMGQLHARTVAGSRLAELVGVVDRDPAVVSVVGRRLGVAAFADVTQALVVLEPDAVVIATPDSLHREATEAVIEAGADVLVEKPLATTVEDAEAMVALAQARGVRLMTGHITRFYPRYAQVHEAVRSGELGRPVMVTASTWGLRSLGARVAHTTNPLWHFAIHDIELVHWMTGGVVDEIDGAQLVESSSGVSTFAATGTVSTGAAFNLVTGWTLPDSAGPRWDLTVHCEHGVVRAAWSDDGVTRFGPDAVDAPDCMAWPNLNGRVEGALRMEVEHFLGAVVGGSPFLVTPDDAVDAVRAAAALEKAATVRRVP